MPEILDRFRSSTWGWLRGTLLGWLIWLLMLSGGVLTLWELLDSTAPGWAAYGRILVFIAAAVVIVQYVRNLMVTYEVTEDRLILRKGIFVKSIDEIELYRVKDIRLDFTLVNQWAGIGTIGIDSSDETTREGALVMPYIERAVERREELRRLVDTARQKRRVRELDVASDFA